MRAESPEQRLAGVARSRGRLLPVPDDPSDLGQVDRGWTPDPDDLPWSTAVGGPALPSRPDGRSARPDDAGQGGRVAAWREDLADRVPVRWRDGRRAVPVRAALTAGAIAAALVFALLTQRLGGSPDATVLPASGATTAGRSGASTATRAPVGGVSATAVGSVPGGSGGALVVDVEGRVRHPGLVRVAAGSRVADAVAAAGGASSGAAPARINLARPLTDGEQVIVPGPGDPVPAADSGSGTAGSGAGGSAAAPVVDLNTATPAQLDGLPGVGPVLAGRIVQWRTAHGRFTSVDQLGEVSGIGDTLLSKLRPLVRV